MRELERATKEPPRPLLLRAVEHFGRHALLDDLPLVHEDHAIADLAGELHLVGDDHHRHALARELAHDEQHLPDELGIERRGDLVEEHHVRLHHQRPRDRHPLLLAARELMRVLRRPWPRARPAQAARGARLGLLAAHPADPPRRERHVVQHGQVRKQIELLEDHPDSLADRRHVGALARDLLALEEDPPRVERLEQVDAAEQRALAAPARADDDEHLAGGDVEVDPVEHEVVAEALPNRLEPNNPAGRLELCRSRKLVCQRTPLCAHSSTQAGGPHWRVTMRCMPSAARRRTYGDRGSTPTTRSASRSPARAFPPRRPRRRSRPPPSAPPSPPRCGRRRAGGRRGGCGARPRGGGRRPRPSARSRLA